MDLNMKPSLAVDEMFSEVAGYMDMEEVRLTRKLKECLTAISCNNFSNCIFTVGQRHRNDDGSPAHTH